MEEIGRRIERVMPAADDDYLLGDPDRAIERLEAAAGNKDWESLFVLANTLSTMEPDKSFQWQSQAYELSGKKPYVLLELAYHYTRREECSKATAAWAQVDAAGLMGSYQPMLAGYCYLKLGQDERAFAMFDRANALRTHGRFEQVLEELWGRRPALREHATHLDAFRNTGDVASLYAGLQNALRLQQGRERGTALLAFANAARASKNTVAVSSDLECLRPAFEAEAAATGADKSKAVQTAWKQQLDMCKLLLADHPLPDDTLLAKFLVVNALNLQLASNQDLLGTYGKELAKRSRSTKGDIEAIRILANLQSKTRDPGLKESDDLGWTRYGDPKFAASRISGEFRGSKLSAEGTTLLKRAHDQFPHEQEILKLWLRYGDHSADDARQGWRELLLMEFRNPSRELDSVHVERVAADLYGALHEYRERADP